MTEYPKVGGTGVRFRESFDSVAQVLHRLRLELFIYKKEEALTVNHLIYNYVT